MMFLLQKKGDASGEHEKFDERMCIVIQPMKKKYHQTWIFSEIWGDFPFLRGVSRVFPNKGFQPMGPENSPKNRRGQ